MSGEGYFDNALSQATLDELAEKAHASGFTLWDTAAVYGMGHSERALWRVLQRFARDDYQLSTKFTPQIGGAGADPVADMLEQSLANLGTDYVDLYWIHNPADVARWTPHLIPLLQSGRIKHVGVSNHNLEEIQLADLILGESGFRVEAAQNHYSLLYRSSENAGILDHWRRNNITLYSYMVLEQGALTGRYNPKPSATGQQPRERLQRPASPVRELTVRLAQLGQPRDASAADVATAWAIAKGTTPIIGVTKPQYIDGLARATGITLTDDEIDELETIADTANVNTRQLGTRDVTDHRRHALVAAQATGLRSGCGRLRPCGPWQVAAESRRVRARPVHAVRR